MFRALRLFPPGSHRAVLHPPVSITASHSQDTAPLELPIQQGGVFATTVGASSKRTLASWHLTAPEEVVSMMHELLN
jgi:trehalose 6-phosphate synthase/phosphatase